MIAIRAEKFFCPVDLKGSRFGEKNAKKRHAFFKSGNKILYPNKVEKRCK